MFNSLHSLSETNSALKKIQLTDLAIYRKKTNLGLHFFLSVTKILFFSRTLTSFVYQSLFPPEAGIKHSLGPKLISTLFVEKIKNLDKFSINLKNFSFWQTSKSVKLSLKAILHTRKFLAVLSMWPRASFYEKITDKF